MGIEAMLEAFLRAIEHAALDALDSIVAGDADNAFCHARDAAHHAHQMMRTLAEQMVEQEGRASLL